MKKGRLYNREEVELISKSAIGKSINDIMNEEIITIGESNTSNKGGLGQLVEQFLFGIQANSDSEPDFMPAGIELKVTPYKKLKDGRLSAKERLVLNIIDYMTEYKNDFKTSHFWFKNNTIQLLWYLWEPNKNAKDLKITNEKLLELEKNEDLKQIEKDWEYIINKIKEGKAHEISEADTMYLGACSKGANANSVREQPFSDIPAMQRAFCFKNSYMTQLVRKYIGDYSNVESILENSNLLFDDYVKRVTDKYIGKTLTELKEIFKVTGKTKDDCSRVVNRMFNLKRGLNETEEFTKANIISKSIRVEKNGKIKEDISFPAFKFNELIKETWYDSELKEQLETTKYMFFIFRNNGEDYVFDGFKNFNMPETIIEEVIKPFWIETVNTIKSGVKFSIKGNKVFNNLPGVSHNGYMHVRPHANKSAYKLKDGTIRGNITKDGDVLPNGEWMTKQAFWFNRSYIKEIINE